jgi:soluble lytic murein transglycosylase-like protein
MQLTPDKCNGANCYDAATNIMLGAKFFKSQVDSFNGNVLEAVGDYNGWSSSMSYSTATNRQWGCAHQNNLDYVCLKCCGS